jgi:hypothetical protein
VLPSATGHFIAPNHTNSNHIDGLPLHDDFASCNCARQGNAKVLLADGTQTSQAIHYEESHTSDEESTQLETVAEDIMVTDDSNEDMYTVTSYCAGCTFNQYQETIKKVRTLRRDNVNVKINLFPEPNNIRDKNAIRISAIINDNMCSLGYIPLKKIPKIMKAMINKEIIDIAIHDIRSVYVNAEKKSVWKCWIKITKKAQWLPDMDITYNADLVKLFDC